MEIVLRAEELFEIQISDPEAAAVRTVGDLYALICTKLDVPPLRSPVTTIPLPLITQRVKVLFFLARHKPLPAPPDVLPWSPQSVWDCLVAIFVDQMVLEPGEIAYDARIIEDLRID